MIYVPCDLSRHPLTARHVPACSRATTRCLLFDPRLAPSSTCCRRHLVGLVATVGTFLTLHAPGDPQWRYDGQDIVLAKAGDGPLPAGFSRRHAFPTNGDLHARLGADEAGSAGRGNGLVACRAAVPERRRTIRPEPTSGRGALDIMEYSAPVAPPGFLHSFLAPRDPSSAPGLAVLAVVGRGRRSCGSPVSASAHRTVRRPRSTRGRLAMPADPGRGAGTHHPPPPLDHRGRFGWRRRPCCFLFPGGHRARPAHVADSMSPFSLCSRADHRAPVQSCPCLAPSAAPSQASPAWRVPEFARAQRLAPPADVRTGPFLARSGLVEFFCATWRGGGAVSAHLAAGGVADQCACVCEGLPEGVPTLRSCIATAWESAKAARAPPRGRHHLIALADEVRRVRALACLELGMAAAEVSLLLGYSEPAVFHRAFRRWTGASTAQWRSAHA